MKPGAPLPVIPVARVASPEDVAFEPARTLEKLDGAPARTAGTRVRFAASARYFVVLFESAAEPPLTLARGSGEDVFRDECVELFLCPPGQPHSYRELVVNPLGAVYSAEVVNPGDSRASWTLVPGSPPAGLLVEVRGEPAAHRAGEWTRWSCRIAVPWSSLPPGVPPAQGEERRGNATRIARGRSTHFLALSPTFRSEPPDFHVPSRFARFLFGGAAA